MLWSLQVTPSLSNVWAKAAKSVSEIDFWFIVFDKEILEVGMVREVL